VTDYTVSSGQTSTGIALHGGDTLIVESGGTAINTTVDKAGGGFTGYFIDGGGVDISATINSGGVQEAKKGPQTGTPGGTAIGATVNKGGEQLVDFGGTAIGTIVYGYQQADGSATGATIYSGGTQLVQLGTANNTTVNSGGLQYINIAKGKATGTTLNSGGHQIVAGGTASDIVAEVVNGGYLDVEKGASPGDSGGSVTIIGTGLLDIGTGRTGSGSVFVTDSGSKLFATNVNIGGAVPISGQCADWTYHPGGVGTLTVSSGGSVFIDNKLTLANFPVFRIPLLSALDNPVTIAGGGLEVGGHGASLAPNQIRVDAGGEITGHGTITIGGSGGIINDGLVVADNGTLAILGNASGGGVFRIDENATLELGAAFSGTVVFNGGYESTLRIDTAKVFTSGSTGLVFNGTISGLANGDTIRFASGSWGSLKDEAPAHAAVVDSKLVVTLHNSQTITFPLAGDVANHTFTFRSVPNVPQPEFALTYEPSSPKIVTGVNGAPTGNPYIVVQSGDYTPDLQVTALVANGERRHHRGHFSSPC
jgi:fibronectin-binding autotransporter adhesin